MRIEIITKPITRTEAKEIAKEFYGDMAKGVVDTKRGIIALGGEYHMDANMALIGNGSQQEHIWGFNVHREKPREEWIECTALINIRPAQGNRGLRIEDEVLCARIREIVNEKIV